MSSARLTAAPACLNVLRVSGSSGKDGAAMRPVRAAILACGVALVTGIGVAWGFVLLLSGTPLHVTVGDPLLGQAALLSAWLTVCCLAAGAAAWVITRFANRRRLNRVVRIVLMAMLTKLLAVLLLPVIGAIWSAPAALNGAELLCYRTDGVCEVGLHGPDAIAGLTKAALSWYPAEGFLLVPGFMDLALVVPSAVWDYLLHRRPRVIDRQPRAPSTRTRDERWLRMAFPDRRSGPR